MLELYGRGKDFIIRNSMFDIRYPFKVRGKSIILELPTADELAYTLHFFRGISGENNERT
jgi:hypothetical protein